MLSMTIRAFLEDARRPVKFVPIYFGYERLIEGNVSPFVQALLTDYAIRLWTSGSRR